MPYLNVRPEWNAGSIADIAFLMLTFFLVTTQISNEKGLPLVLPRPDNTSAPVHKRNIFTIQINSANQFMVRGESRADLSGVREEIKNFIMNNGQLQQDSDNPEKAVVSLKADRGSYYELYAQQAGVGVERFRRLDLTNPIERALHEKGKKGIPMNISIVQ